MKHIKSLCIVVVEDNLFYQQLIAKQLESITTKVIFYTNGEDFLEELAEVKADLIVLDNNLGGTLTGLETLKEIRTSDSNVHVILFSTELKLDSSENFATFGTFEYVEKNNAGFKMLKERIMKSEVYIEGAKLKV